MNTESRRILILAANPRNTGTLRLKQEETDIINVLNRAKQRNAFEVLPPCRGVTTRELQEKLLNQEPDIVHFSGHGGGEPGIYVEDELGNAKLVSDEGLAGLFSICEQVECVILNACFSKVQAEAIARHVPYVIGMNDEIGDLAALEFAYGFYTALGAGKSYEAAYKNGCNSILLEQPQGKQHQIPGLITKKAPETVPTLWIHGWKKHTHNGKPTVELDWTNHFCQSPWRFPNASILDKDLLPQLEKLQNEWANTYADKLIEIRSTLPLSMMLALGQQFSECGRWRFQVDQPPDLVLWTSDPSLASSSSVKLVVREQMGEGGKNILVALGIINGTSTRNGAKRLMDNAPSGFFESFIYAEPDADEGALLTNADIVRLARQAKQLLTNCNGSNIHLVIAAPAAFCLFLGQQLNALGEVQIYEWQREERRYEPTLKLKA